MNGIQYNACSDAGKTGYPPQTEIGKPGGECEFPEGALVLECGFRTNLVVNRKVAVELKAQTAIHPVDKAQTIFQLRLLNLWFGLLMKFHEVELVDGVNGYE